MVWLGLSLSGSGAGAQETRPSATPITIDAVEWIVGKFHRKDHQKHPYEDDNRWKPMILPQDAEQSPLVYSSQVKGQTVHVIQFKTLEELLKESIRLSESLNAPIGTLNIHAHGLPGGQFFAKDQKTLVSSECEQWRDLADADDAASYNQYYSIPSKYEVFSIRRLGDSVGGKLDCVTGVNEWKDVLANVTSDIKRYFSPQIQINLLSCVVGYGKRGQDYLLGLAQLLLPAQGAGRVNAAVQFGLGDWSMKEGMGFWDYQDDRQLARDAEIYTRTKKDADVQQQGTIRYSTLAGGTASWGDLPGQWVLRFDAGAPLASSLAPKRTDLEKPSALSTLPELQDGDSIRIPGTQIKTRLRTP